jgi:hypothetical protein
MDPKDFDKILDELFDKIYKKYGFFQQSKL